MLSNDLFKQAQFSFKRWVLYFRIEPGRCFHDGFVMAECGKGKPAMIRSHTTMSPAPEWQVIIGQVPTRIVYATSSESNRFQPFFFCGRSFREYIKSKWVGIALDDVFGFFKFVEAYHR